MKKTNKKIYLEQNLKTYLKHKRINNNKALEGAFSGEGREHNIFC